MKKRIVCLLLGLWGLGLTACGKTLHGSDVYAFPEPTTQITGIVSAQGTQTPFSIGSSTYDADDLSVLPVMEWFYGLELRACGDPEPAEGNAVYSVSVGNLQAFTYDHRGDTAFLLVNDSWYAVENPAPPPLEGNAPEGETTAAEATDP